ncbi:TetR/AcrR family transcriptional regulator [Serpentinicella sp. ANB-PHB4]|uniref:TetR/AcrR family transcriptional regulator n=1 Tax=Serpentinicella sp. ANB-PHB4 TaxID=3074076 RepID=UPI002856D888|nr:TetR/AcrR family transcriptional regulator [Serpentinicella sp. ANB-PHB4]MDR5658686.1 TetR/AcrR family transcriptional regulator [Serpentinicella sp. ANB-PHB4]
MSKIKREEEILQGAIKVFSQYGFYKAKMEDIAKEAGVGKGTVYEYYASKEELFHKMVDYVVNNYIEAASSTVNNEKTLKDKLITFAQHHGSFIKEHMDMVDSILSNPSAVSKEFKVYIEESQDRFFEFFNQIIEGAKANGEIREDIDTYSMALTIVGAINQYYGKRIVCDKEDIDNIDPDSIIRIILDGIAR